LFLNFTANHSALFPYFANHGRNSHLPLGLYIRTLSLSYKRYFFIIIYGLVSCSFALQDTIPSLQPPGQDPHSSNCADPKQGPWYLSCGGRHRAEPLCCCEWNEVQAPCTDCVHSEPTYIHPHHLITNIWRINVLQYCTNYSWWSQTRSKLTWICWLLKRIY
jgi:hypothetical protein